jgi:hypothetical protein
VGTKQHHKGVQIMADLQEIFRVEGLRLFNIAKLLKLRKEIHNITESNLRLDRH